MKIPIMPPYTPATGITQSPAQSTPRRPPNGILSADERRIEGSYLPHALAIVERMGGQASVEQISLVILRETKIQRFSPRLVYSLKQRLDTIARNRAQ